LLAVFGVTPGLLRDDFTAQLSNILGRDRGATIVYAAPIWAHNTFLGSTLHARLSEGDHR